MKKILNFTVLFSVLIVSLAFAQIPQTMSYQGVLTGADGNPVADGSVSLTFKLYANATGGTALWEETQQVTTANGLFNAILGSVNPLNLPFDKPYWLGITVGQGSEMTPRIALTASPYSIAAKTIVGNGEVVRLIKTQNATHTDTVTIIGAGATSVASHGDTIVVSSTDTGGGGKDNDWVDTGTSVHTANKTIQLMTAPGVFPFTVNNGANPAARLEATSVNDGIHGTSSNAGDGVVGEAVNGSGVQGKSQASFGVFGTTMGLAVVAAGVHGEGNNAVGVEGESLKDNGVVGTTSATGQAGVFGDGGKLSVGVIGSSVDDDGVQGESQNADGVQGSSEFKNGVFGKTGGNSSPTVSIAGVHGEGGAGAPGVYGYSKKTGVFGQSLDGIGIRGNSFSGPAGQFEGEVHILNGPKSAKLKIDQMEVDNSAPCLVWSGDHFVRMRECWTLEDDAAGTSFMVSSKGIRVRGGASGNDVVFEVDKNGRSLHKGTEVFKDSLIIMNGNGTVAMTLMPNADPNTQYALTLNGNIMINGMLQATAKDFKIDHPLDPENKYLTHTSVESPDMKTVYDGVVSLDENGAAEVEMPDWFEALNGDFRYQLTCIGGFAQVYIAEEIHDNQFRIAGGTPGMKVSWQVTGIRHDAWAQEHRQPVEGYK